MKTMFLLDGLRCASCAGKIERDVGKLDGVGEVYVNFITSKMVLECGEDALETIISRAEKIIKKYEPDVKLRKA